MRQLKRFAPIIAIPVFSTGLLILYFSLFGSRITYTKTYRHLATLIPFLSPFINLELLFFIGMCSLQFLLIALAPGAKYGALLHLANRRRLRILVLLGSIIVAIPTTVAIVLALFVRTPTANRWASSLESLVTLFATTMFALLAFAYAIRPQALVERKHLDKPWPRLAAAAASVALGLSAVAGIEVLWVKPNDQQLSLRPASGPPVRPTHSISAIVVDTPRNVSSGDSFPLAVRFRLTEYDAQASGLRYPISLARDHRFGVSASLRAIGFEVAEPPKPLSRIRECPIDHPIQWDWLLTPKEGREGTRQQIIVDLFLHDLTENRLVKHLPFTTIQLKIGTPLGLPAWLLSPSLGLGALLGGLMSLLLPPFIADYLEVRRRNTLSSPSGASASSNSDASNSPPNPTAPADQKASLPGR